MPENIFQNHLFCGQEVALLCVHVYICMPIRECCSNRVLCQSLWLQFEQRIVIVNLI